ncbi:hypothetical protein NECAME_03250, partial [Necator americanus]
SRSTLSGDYDFEQTASGCIPCACACQHYCCSMGHGLGNGIPSMAPVWNVWLRHGHGNVPRNDVGQISGSTIISIVYTIYAAVNAIMNYSSY